MDYVDHMEHLNSGEQSEAGPCPTGFMAAHADFLPVPFIPQGRLTCVAVAPAFQQGLFFFWVYVGSDNRDLWRDNEGPVSTV